MQSVGDLAESPAGRRPRQDGEDDGNPGLPGGEGLIHSSQVSSLETVWQQKTC